MITVTLETLITIIMIIIKITEIIIASLFSSYYEEVSVIMII